MHTRIDRAPLFAGVLLALLVGCSQESGDRAAAAPEGATPAAATVDAVATAGKVAANRPAEAPAAPEAKDASTVPTAAQLASTATTYSDAQRKFIRTAHADFRVKDVYTSAIAIENLVAGQGGFVVRNEISTDTQGSQRRPSGDGKLIELTQYVTRGVLVVRVPSDATQNFLRSLVAQVEFLDHRTFEADDAQFQMLRQQLAWQRSQDAQQEIGQAEQQGGRLDQKTEALQGRDAARSARDEALVAQKEFADKVAFSTIELAIYQTPRIRATEMVDVEAEFERNRPGFVERFGVSLRNGWLGLLDLIVALVVVWPLWLAVVVIAGLVRVFRRKSAAA